MAPAAPPPDAGFVTITNAEVYALLMEVDRKVSPLPEQVADQGKRITALERLVWSASGLTGLGGTILGAVLARALGHA